MWTLFGASSCLCQEYTRGATHSKGGAGLAEVYYGTRRRRRRADESGIGLQVTGFACDRLWITWTSSWIINCQPVQPETVEVVGTFYPRPLYATVLRGWWLRTNSWRNCVCSILGSWCLLQLCASREWRIRSVAIRFYNYISSLAHNVK